MTIETDLSVSPYFDESAYGLTQNYYKVLFKPAVPVQVRELNELQSILQNQIELFGDNVLKRGTIVKGCTFSFYNSYPYLKIKDNYNNGQPVDIVSLAGQYIESSTGHRALVLKTADGFEQTTPDTKTLYVQYINSGNEGGNTSFAPNDLLTIFDRNHGVSKVNITSTGTGYSNSATAVFVSQIAVRDNTAAITVGHTLTQPSTGANVVVSAVDSTTYNDKIVIKVKPTDVDFANSSASANAWTMVMGTDNGILDAGNASIAMSLVEIIGSGASAIVTTDSSMRVKDVSMVDVGSGYYYAPYVAVRDFGGAIGAVVETQNYYNKVSVLSDAEAVGNAYAFGVSDGVIYQKGYFLNVNSQIVVVSKYSRYPNNVSVGFNTNEDIVDAYKDTNLLDNSQGTRNYAAPGADRLQLSPELIILDSSTARSNTSFFSLVDFSEGIPYNQNQRTAYNAVNDEMATRTAQSAGDYVIDPFLVSSRANSNDDISANTFTLVVDPGTAYIDGYRTQTYGNYSLAADKGIDTTVVNTAITSLNYGSYIVVNELAGDFPFSAGASARLFDTAKQYLTNNVGTVIATTGTQIGSARMRSLVPLSRNPLGVTPGAPNFQYAMYIFDVQMNSGMSFKNVKSVAYYDGASYKGIADVVQTYASPFRGNGTTSYSTALISAAAANGATLDKMLFDSGYDSPLQINNISYSYRTANDTAYALSNTGLVTIVLNNKNYFPYSGSLSSDQLADLVFYPMANVYANQATTGTVFIANNTSGNVVLNANVATSFVAELQTGDYIAVANATANNLKRVVSVINASAIVVDSAFAAATNHTQSTITRAFPQNIPFPLLTRNGMSAAVTVDVGAGTRTLTANLNTRFSFSGNSTIGAAFNIKVIDSNITAKTPKRNLYAEVSVANNTTGFGLTGVSSVFSGSFTSGCNVVTVAGSDQTFTAGDFFNVSSGSVTAVKQVNSVNSTAIVMSNTANFTDSANITKAINVNGPWCLGVPDVFRLRGVYLASNSSVSESSSDVTRDFAIDHNQNPNYYGLSYLVKNKNSKLVINATDWLLVKFDAFTTTTEGDPVIINSYVDGTAANRYAKDTLALSDLDTHSGTPLYVNTLEIPEVHGPNGDDYDLISQLDFRPRASNTANLSTTIGGATINPAATVAFTTDDKKFPYPNAECDFQVEYFKGRVDSVYVDASGKIGVSTGHPTSPDNLTGSRANNFAVPVKNKKVLVLNNVVVPAYPSMEELFSSRIRDIIDTKVINEQHLGRRLDKKKITRLFTSTDIAISQPTGYTMEKIGTLERRIKDLEYYVALTNLEVQIRDLNLPSSLVGNISRAKYGFFADGFDNSDLTNLDSPEYMAVVEKSRVIPRYEVFKTEFPAPTCPYDDYFLLGQLRATGNAANVVGNTVHICTNTAILERKQKDAAEKGSASQYYTDYVDVSMASALGNNSGKVSIYCWFYSAADSIFVYQSTTANSFANDAASAIVTSNSAVALTNSDVAYLKTLPWFSEVAGSLNTTLTKTATNPTYGLKFGGKITFTHNPNSGKYYRFKVDKGPGSVIWRYRVEYPVNVDCNVVAPPPPPPQPKSFVGTLKFYSGSNLKVNSGGGDYSGGAGDTSKGPTAVLTYNYSKFFITASGLKPLTKHKLFADTQDVTSMCAANLPTDKNSNEEIKALTWGDINNVTFASSGYVMTDASGKIGLELYFLESVTSISGHYGDETVKQVEYELKSDDGTSYSTGSRPQPLITFTMTGYTSGGQTSGSLGGASGNQH